MNIKDKRHILSFNKHQENLNISDVRSSDIRIMILNTIVIIKNIKQWKKISDYYNYNFTDNDFYRYESGVYGHVNYIYIKCFDEKIFPETSHLPSIGKVMVRNNYKFVSISFDDWERVINGEYHWCVPEHFRKEVKI